MSTLCYHCKSELANKDARFCFSCYKPQETKGSEVIQVTTVRDTEENKHPSNDVESKQNAPNHSLIPPAIYAKMMTSIPTAIQLDKQIRNSKETGVHIKISKKDRKTLIMRDRFMTDMEYTLRRWWKSSGYTCELLQDRDHMYVFAEIIQSLHAVFRTYRKEHDSEVTQEMIDVGDKLDILERIFTNMIFCVFCVGMMWFIAFIGWLSTGAKEEGTVFKINVGLTLTAVVGFLMLLLIGYYDHCVNKKMSNYKRKFQNGLLNTLQQRISEINAMEAVSPYIYINMYDEREWIAHALNDEKKAKEEVKNNSATKIVVRIFVFSLDGNSFKALYAPDCKISKGTIYSERNVEIHRIAHADNYNS